MGNTNLPQFGAADTKKAGIRSSVRINVPRHRKSNASPSESAAMSDRHPDVPRMRPSAFPVNSMTRTKPRRSE